MRGTSKDLGALGLLVGAAAATPSSAQADTLLRRAKSTIESELVLPESSFFATANVAYASTLNVRESDGDLWPTTWADDGALYTANGDGRGFSQDDADWRDIVISRIDGNPDDGITGKRLAGNESLGDIWTDGEYNRKPTGIIAVDGDGDGKDELYLAIQDLNAGPSGPGGGPTGEAFNDAPAASIVRSTDYGVTWKPTEKAMFTEHRFTTIFFLDFGQSNSRASVLGEDGAKYVYAYGLDNNWRDSINNAVKDPQKLYLARAPIGSIQDIATWEFFSGTSSEPGWECDINKRQPVLEDLHRDYPGGTAEDGFSVLSQGGVVYNEGMKRYIYSSWTDYSFRFYESSQPWGPFTLFHQRDFGDGPWYGLNTTTPKNGGYGTTIPSKFISEDGTKMWVQSNWFVDVAPNSDFNYCFSLRPLTVAQYKPDSKSSDDNDDKDDKDDKDEGKDKEKRADEINLAQQPGANPVDKASHFGNLPYLNDGNTDGSEDSWDNSTKNADRWGYTWPASYKFAKVIYTTGDSFPDGGYFASDLTVNVRNEFKWTAVSGLKIDPPYPYDSSANPKKEYTFTFDAVVGDGIEIIGVPGGDASFTSISELQVYQASEES